MEDQTPDADASLTQPTASDRKKLAREQTALFPTRLALARWTRGGDVPHVFGHSSQVLKAAWYAQAERNFQAWLDHGGFAQHDPKPVVVQPAVTKPVQDDDGRHVGACI